MPKLIPPTPVFGTAEGYAPADEDPGPFASVAAGEIGGRDPDRGWDARRDGTIVKEL